MARLRCVAKDISNLEGVCDGDPIPYSYFCVKHSKNIPNEDFSYGQYICLLCSSFDKEKKYVSQISQNNWKFCLKIF